MLTVVPGAAVRGANVWRPDVGPGCGGRDRGMNGKRDEGGGGGLRFLLRSGRSLGEIRRRDQDAKHIALHVMSWPTTVRHINGIRAIFMIVLPWFGDDNLHTDFSLSKLIASAPIDQSRFDSFLFVVLSSR